MLLTTRKKIYCIQSFGVEMKIVIGKATFNAVTLQLPHCQLHSEPSAQLYQLVEPLVGFLQLFVVVETEL